MVGPRQSVLRQRPRLSHTVGIKSSDDADQLVEPRLNSLERGGQPRYLIVALTHTAILAQMAVKRMLPTPPDRHLIYWRAGMARIYVFIDEAGDFTFSRKEGASRYFMIGSATMSSTQLGADLLDLRRKLAFDANTLIHEFHAANDKQAVRDLVFDLIAKDSVRIDATILDKTKTQDHLRQDPLRFYKQALYLHLKYVAQHIAGPLDELFVVTSSLQIKKKKKAVRLAMLDVVSQASRSTRVRAAFWPASCDPCLQVADYATWAIQRKYERDDSRSYDLIAHRIESEFQPFLNGGETYY